MKRFTYDVNEPEDFEKLLQFWAKQDMYPPIFVEWINIQTNDSATAVYWLETDLYRASLHITRTSSEEVVDAFQRHNEHNHEFIECRVYADDEECEVL